MVNPEELKPEKEVIPAELEKKVEEEKREKRFEERLDLWFRERKEDLTEEERSKLHEIHEKIEAADAGWVAGVMKEAGIKAGKEAILGFEAKDVDTLQEILKEHPEIKPEEGLVKKQFVLLREEFEKRKEAEKIELKSPEAKEAQELKDSIFDSEEELLRYLDKHPSEALAIARKGIEEKLAKVVIDFTKTRDKIIAEIGKKATYIDRVGYGAYVIKPLWSLADRLKIIPGRQREDELLKYYRTIDSLHNLERLGKLSPEKARSLVSIAGERFKTSTVEAPEELEACHKAKEKREKDLKNCRSFLRGPWERLNRWKKKKEEEAETKKKELEREKLEEKKRRLRRKREQELEKERKKAEKKKAQKANKKEKRS